MSLALAVVLPAALSAYFDSLSKHHPTDIFKANSSFLASENQVMETKVKSMQQRGSSAVEDKKSTQTAGWYHRERSPQSKDATSLQGSFDRFQNVACVAVKTSIPPLSVAFETAKDLLDLFRAEAKIQEAHETLKKEDKNRIDSTKDDAVNDSGWIAHTAPLFLNLSKSTAFSLTATLMLIAKHKKKEIKRKLRVLESAY